MDYGWDRDGGREGAPWVHPSQFVGVESLAIAGFTAGTALQGRILLQLFDGQRFFAVGAETIEAEIHLAKRRIDPLEAQHALFHLGQIQPAGEFDQLILFAVIDPFCPVVTARGFELSDQRFTFLSPVGQQAITPDSQLCLRHFTHIIPHRTYHRCEAV